MFLNREDENVNPRNSFVLWGKLNQILNNILLLLISGNIIGNVLNSQSAFAFRCLCGIFFKSKILSFAG